jgi:phospholipid/cholesterol/gamma-HCH transport system substrate-binding protein
MKRAALAVLSALALSGCGVTAADLPLPGGSVGGPTYRLTAVFGDALNLPDKAHVKLDGVDVGVVEDISANEFTARVTMAVQQKVVLPKGTTAELRQATPLGDVFVALHLPKGDGEPLREGDTIPISATSSAATVEDTLAALSALVNGGGLGQLKTIIREVNTALDGRGAQTAHLINELTTTLVTLNQRTNDIDRILNSTASLTETAKQRQGTIDAAFAELSPALKVLSGQTDRLTKVLTEVSQVSDLGNKIVNQTQDQLRSVLRDLGPVLDGFNGLQSSLGPTLANMIQVSKLLAGATEGESAAGMARLVGFTGIPVIGNGKLPDGQDFDAGFQAFTQNFAELLRRMGVPR